MRSTAGMTLIEVTVASVALTTGIFAVFGAMGTSSQVRNRAKMQGYAIESIQAEIERIQTMSFNSVATLVPASSGMSFAVTGLTPPAGRAKAGSVIREADSTSTRLHLRFTVDWADPTGAGQVVIHYHHINRGG
ncbi:MAG: hypothetical protein J0M02_07945 [Planctomycetes bacterium]|nr:hypothetical protein [Planctomycetota bacterium]